MAAQHTPLGEEIGIHLFTAESYSTHSLIDRVTAPVLERRAPAPGLAPQDVTLLLDSLRRWAHPWRWCRPASRDRPSSRPFA